MNTSLHRAARLGLALALLAFAPGLASAATFNPSPGAADGAPNSLRSAVEQANANGQNDTIVLEAGTYVLTMGELQLTSDGFTIVGDGPMSSIIRQEGSSRVFTVSAGVRATFRSLEIRGGRAAENGGGVLNSGDTRMDNVRVIGNVALGNEATNGGGGIYNDGVLSIENGSMISSNQAAGTLGSGGGVLNTGMLTVVRSALSNNRARRAGGGIEDQSNTTGAVTLRGVELNLNVAASRPGNGGAVHVTGSGGFQMTGGTVRNNRAASEGGGLWNGTGSMMVTNVTFTGNTAQGASNGGGALFNNGGTLEIFNSSLMRNNATGASGSGGGIFHAGGTTTVQRSRLEGNSANRAGGGIELATGGSVRVEDTAFASNRTGSAPGNGGAIHVTAGNVTVTGSSADNNYAASEGGAFWNNAGWTMSIDEVTFMGNEAAGADASNGGGALFNNGGTLNINGSTIAGNRASGAAGSGGGILNETGGTLSVTDSEVSSNTANRAGGGVEERGGQTTLTNVMLASNTVGTAPGNGGGMHIGGSGVATVTRSEVAGNTAGGEGGGLWNSGAGTLTVSFTSVTGNSAPDGGGLYQSGSGGTLNVSQSLVATNTADRRGGGIFSEGGDVNVDNSTISSNTAERGAGLLTQDGAFDLRSVTLAANAADERGGGFLQRDGAVLTLRNTIVGDNTAPGGPDGFGRIVSADWNLVEQVAGFTYSGAVANSKVRMDPMFAPLADNGGPTLTHALREGSPAINMGNSEFDTDQRGYARDAGQDDMGAFELGGTAPPMMLASGDGTSTEAAAAPEAASAKTMTEAVRLDAVAPNPLASGRAGTLTFAVREAEAVEVTLYDVAGRRIQTLYSGTPQASQTQSVALDASRLAAGVYVVRLVGETVQATRRVTVVR